MYFRRNVSKLNKGFTLAELLIVVAVMLVLAATVFMGVIVQISKAKDAKRKADLDQLKTAMVDFFGDYGRFPREDELPACGAKFDRYLNGFPCDPVTGKPYIYVRAVSGTWFKLYTRLAWKQDPVVTQIGCQSGCGPGNAYNYGVSSDNVKVGEGVTEEGTQPTCGGPGNWFCFANVCAECCPGSSYRCNGTGTRCILDGTCSQ